MFRIMNMHYFLRNNLYSSIALSCHFMLKTNITNKKVIEKVMKGKNKKN